jgi:hypothetical protein
LPWHVDDVGGVRGHHRGQRADAGSPVGDHPTIQRAGGGGVA